MSLYTIGSILDNKIIINIKKAFITGMVISKTYLSLLLVQGIPLPHLALVYLGARSSFVLWQTTISYQQYFSLLLFPKYVIKFFHASDKVHNLSHVGITQIGVRSRRSRGSRWTWNHFETTLLNHVP